MRYINSNCTYTQNYSEGTYTFTGPCRVTGDSYTVTIPGSELFDLNQGLPVQDALKSLDREQREFVMSGTSPEGWEKLFGPLLEGAVLNGAGVVKVIKKSLDL